MNHSTVRTFAFALAFSAAYFSTEEARAHPNHPPVPVLEITTDLTWSKDIRPIYREKCMSCHSPTGILPLYFSLSTYDGSEDSSGAADWAYGAAEEVLTRRMPPWGADPRYNAFANDRRLTQEEIDTIVEWAHGGRPEGLDKDLPTPPEYAVPSWSLGTPDRVFEMPQPHALTGERADTEISVSFAVDTGGEDKWVAAVEFLPGTPKVVHTMIAVIHDPDGAPAYAVEMEAYNDYDPMADTDQLTRIYNKELPAGPRFLGQWVRGDSPLTFPSGVGKLLRAGSTVELIVRYDPIAADALARPTEDQSRIGIHFMEDGVKRIGETLSIENAQFVIPAGEADYEIRASEILQEGTYLYALYPHMGVVASDLEVLAHYPDGRSVTLLYIPRFDDSLNQSYLFGKPLFAPEETRVEVIAHFDNSEDNWDNPYDPPEDLEAPSDERLLVYVDHYTPGWINIQEELGEPSEKD